ncbi:MAG: hypothetical protein HYU66_28115 [Armatimonadetes bacterium]|nr:hypothetical protein [Armatimonadota bacterium]
MRRLPRDEVPAGAYDIRFRLERSYRAYGWPFFAVGLLGFAIGMLTGHPWLFIAAGGAAAAGLWIYFKDPREYLIVQPRRRRLQIVRVFGKQTRVRGDYDLREFVRLETARYLLRPRGLRCMLLLFRADGSVEKVDDRVDDKELSGLCCQVAEAAGLEYDDRWRVDLEPPARVGDAAADKVELTV